MIGRTEGNPGDTFPFLGGMRRKGPLLVGRYELAPLGPKMPVRPNGSLPFACPPDITLTALDIETTGLGGASSLVFLVGLGQAGPGGIEVTQILAPDLPWEEDLLAELHARLNDGTDRLLVTYNGDTFDLPFLRTRARFQRTPLTLPASYDVLALARRLYRPAFDSLRLTALEAARLRHIRTDDLPGALVPQTYYTALRREDLSSLEPVLRHNALDLAATLGLLGAMAEDLSRPLADTSAPLLLGRARVHIALGEPGREEATRALCALLDEDPGWSVRATALRLLDQIYRAHGEVVARHAKWAAEARRLDSPPEHLVVYAKILEHELRDFAAAYAVTLEALARARARARLVGRPFGSPLEEDLSRRLSRLERRIRKRAPA